MRFPILVSLALLWLCAPLSRAQASLSLYSDALDNGWQNWSWATVDLSNTIAVHGGTTAIKVTAGATQALALEHPALDTSLFENVTFWIHGGTTGGQTLQVRATRDWVAQPPVALPAPTAGTWTQVTLSLASLGVANCTDFDGLWIQNSGSAATGTFYIDDVALTFPAAPASIALSVDAGDVLQTLDSRMYGTNLVMWDPLASDAQTGARLQALQFGALRFPGGSLSDDYDWQTNRRVSGNPNWTWSSHVADFAAVVEEQGADAYVIVNYGSGTPEQAAAWVAYHNGDPASTQALGTDSRGRDWKTVGYWASIRAAAPLATDDGYNFLRVSHPAPYGFKYWEVGNECYGTWENDQHGVAGSGLSGKAHDPVTYAAAYQQFVARMKAVDPTISIGAVITAEPDDYALTDTTPVTNPVDGSTHTGWTSVLLARLKALGAIPDFVVFHYYAQNPGTESDFALLHGVDRLNVDAASIRQMLTDYLGTDGAGVEMAMTELNSVSSDPGKQTANLVNALFYAEAYGTLTRSEYRSVLWWALHNSAETANNNDASLYGWRQFGCYDLIAGDGFPGLATHTPLPTYWAAKLLTHWARGGAEILAASTSYPWLTVHAARAADGDVRLLVINKHSTDALTGQIALTDFAPGSSTATVYSYGKENDAQGAATPGYTTATFTGAGANFAYTFPSYSITVIELASPATFTAQPASVAVDAGGSAQFAVTVTSSGSVTYRWQRSTDEGANWSDLADGAAFSGTGTATLTVAQANVADSGSKFRCVVTVAGAGQVVSNAATLTLHGSQFAALSARAPAGTGEQTLILGFVFAGGGKPTLVRGVGPGISATVSGYLRDPQLRLYSGSGAEVASNDDWAGGASLSAAFAKTGAGALYPTSKDAALHESLTANVYTAHVSGANGTTGVALAEAYDANLSDKTKRLTALSVRNQVGVDDAILIAGFVIAGDAPKQVIVRGVGPGISETVSGYLHDPQLQVWKLDTATGKWTLAGENDDWDHTATTAALFKAAGMGELTVGSKDAALVLTLDPGIYTAQVSGVGRTTGVGVVEIYEVP